MPERRRPSRRASQRCARRSARSAPPSTGAPAQDRSRAGSSLALAGVHGLQLPHWRSAPPVACAAAAASSPSCRTRATDRCPLGFTLLGQTRRCSARTRRGRRLRGARGHASSRTPTTSRGLQFLPIIWDVVVKGRTTEEVLQIAGGEATIGLPPPSVVELDSLARSTLIGSRVSGRRRSAGWLLIQGALDSFDDPPDHRARGQPLSRARVLAHDPLVNVRQLERQLRGTW